MHPTRRRTRLAATVFAAALAACGGTIDDDKNDSPSATGPTATLTSGVVGTASGPITLFVRFSVDVGSSFTASDIAVSGGAVSQAGITPIIEGREYSLVVIPNADSSGTLDVTLPPGSFAAAQGGVSNSQAPRFSLPYDMRGPASVPDVRIIDTANGGVARSSTITFRFLFDVDVGDSFTAADIGVSGGAAGALSKDGATLYTLVVNLPSATRGTVLLTLPAASFVNAGTGESNLRQIQYQASYDTP